MNGCLSSEGIRKTAKWMNGKALMCHFRRRPVHHSCMVASRIGA